MKNVINCLFFFCLVSYSNAQTSHAVEIYSSSIKVNSRTHIGGGNRQVLELNIPSGARFVIFSMQIEKSSDKSAARLGRKALLSAVTRKYKVTGVATATIVNDIIDMGQSYYENIDLYVLSNYRSVSEFKKRLENNFSRIYEWEDLGNTTLEIPTDGSGTMYIGFHNTNMTVGLTTYIQAVAVY